MTGLPVFDDADLQAVQAVLARGNLCSIGPDTESARFEQEFAAEFGSPLGLTIVNAMAGLHAGVVAAGAGAGDEVICDPMVVFGALAVMYNNAVPVFADIDRDSHLIDPAAVAALVTERTKAILVTHLWGLMADMEALRAIADQHGLMIIEDCSHAIYATYKGQYAGTVGDVGVFSFQQSKQMALGDGGMTLMKDPAVREVMVQLTTFGTCPERLSWNYRMNEVVAALGRVQLKRARGYVEACVRNAERLNQAVRGFEALLQPQVNPDPANRWNSYHIWAASFEGDRVGVSREAFLQACADEGLSISLGYIGAPAYKQKTIRDQIGYGRDCPRGCPLAQRHPDYTQDLCPQAEDLMPRLLLLGTKGEAAVFDELATKLYNVLTRLSR